MHSAHLRPGVTGGVRQLATDCSAVQARYPSVRCQLLVKLLYTSFLRIFASSADSPPAVYVDTRR